MKKLVVALATVFAAAVMVSSATADGPIIEERGFACGVLDRGPSFVLTFDSYFAWFDSGKTYLRCEADGTPGSQKIQYTFENTGILCGVPVSGLTDEWKNTIGANGHIQLTCKGFLNPNTVDADASTGGAGLG